MGVVTKVKNMVNIYDIEVGQFFLYREKVHIKTIPLGVDENNKMQSICIKTGQPIWIFSEKLRKECQSRDDFKVEVISKRKASLLLLLEMEEEES